MRERHPSVIAVWKFKTDVSKETLRVGVYKCNKTIISETVRIFFPLVKTSGYHLKVFVFKLTQIYICQTSIVEKH